MNKKLTMTALAANVLVVGACSWVMAQPDPQELKCLADNVYFESSTQSKAGQVAVANVTLNRVDSPAFPNTICDVVWEDRQFSWTHDGKSDSPEDQDAYNTIYNLVELVYNETIVDITEGATFYHADYVTPHWASTMDKQVAHIDQHIFYKHKGR